jgi:hypothetical protein
VRERRHHVARTRTINAVLRRDVESGLNALAEQRVSASTQGEKRVQVRRVRDVLEYIDGRENRRDELYGPLPCETLGLEFRAFPSFGQF